MIPVNWSLFFVDLPPSTFRYSGSYVLPPQYVQTEMPTSPLYPPFEVRNWKQSTSPSLSRCTFQQKAACPWTISCSFPLTITFFGFQSQPSTSPRRIALGSTGVPRLSATTDPAALLNRLNAPSS